MIEFKPIELCDADIIKKFLDKRQNLGCEMCFGSLYIWRKAYDMRYAIIDDCLVLWSKDGENPAGLRFPIGEKNIFAAAQSACDYMQSIGEIPQFYGVTEDIISLIKNQADEYEIYDMSQYSDYVYETERLITLSGKKLHSKKNHLNKFKRTYDYEYCNIKNTDLEDIISAYDEWSELGDDKYLLAERESIIDIIKNIDYLDMTGAMIKVDGRVVAFSFGERLNDSTAVIHIEKANTEYYGAYAAINQMFAEHSWYMYKYINREDDCGLEGLKKAKLSYQPVFMTKKYKIIRK